MCTAGEEDILASDFNLDFNKIGGQKCSNSKMLNKLTINKGRPTSAVWW